MNIEQTGRGFSRINFVEANGSACSLQISSAIKDEYLCWLGVDKADVKIMKPGNGWHEVELPEGAEIFSRMHLTQSQVKELLPHLINFVEFGQFHEETEFFEGYKYKTKNGEEAEVVYKSNGYLFGHIKCEFVASGISPFQWDGNGFVMGANPMFDLVNPAERKAIRGADCLHEYRELVELRAYKERVNKAATDLLKHWKMLRDGKIVNKAWGRFCKEIIDGDNTSLANLNEFFETIRIIREQNG